MNRRLLAILAATTSGFWIDVPHARGDFVRLVTALEFPNQMTPAGLRDVYHVFAEFTDPQDRVGTWYGSAENPFTIQNVFQDGTTVGSGFTNFGGNKTPPKTPGSPQDWDTFPTIGIRFGFEGPFGGFNHTISPAFPAFIIGNSVTSPGESLTLPLLNEQGAGYWRVVGNDTAFRVLLMQLTVNVGQHVRGTINVGGFTQTADGFQEFTAIGQTFNSVSGPGAGAFLGLAFLAKRSRRR